MVFRKKRTYLDWASAAPVSGAARRAFQSALVADGNPSSPHTEGRAAKDILEAARLAIARLAGTKPEAVVFTSGATEANNIALRGRAITPGQHVLYLPSAHASIVETIRAMETEGVLIEPLILKDAAVDLASLTKQIRPETVLVAMDAVCGETGTRFDVRGIRRALDEARKGGGARIALHADASQLPLIESIELTRIAADTLTLDAQKVGGVRGIGALVLRPGTKLSPILQGGGQERGLRPGTESPALAAAFAAALTEASQGYGAFETRAGAARTRLIETIRRGISNMEINEGKETAPHILNLSLRDRDTDYAVALLDKAGFAVSTKSACETDAEGSRAVQALTSDTERAASTLRISWGPTTPMKDLERFAGELVRTVRFLDAHRL
jgi:cysteine desulfurase